MISGSVIPEDLRAAGRVTVAWRKCVITTETKHNGSVQTKAAELKQPCNHMVQLEIFTGMTGGCLLAVPRCCTCAVTSSPPHRGLCVCLSTSGCNLCVKLFPAADCNVKHNDSVAVPSKNTLFVLKRRQLRKARRFCGVLGEHV